MMRCAGNSGRLQHALAVFGEMKASGVQANRDIYNHLIVACGNAPRPQVCAMCQRASSNRDNNTFI